MWPVKAMCQNQIVVQLPGKLSQWFLLLKQAGAQDCT